jgi:hypothetical protein
MIAEMADLSVNIVHLSTKRSLEAVERARQRGPTNQPFPLSSNILLPLLLQQPPVLITDDSAGLAFLEKHIPRTIIRYQDRRLLKQKR